MSRFTPEAQLEFLVCCIRNTTNGRVDFDEVAKELNIVSKGAAAKRYERLLKGNGTESHVGSTSRTSSSPAGPAGSTPGGVAATPLPETPKTPMKSSKGKVGSGKVAASPTRGSGSGGQANEPASPQGKSTDSTVTYYSSSSSASSKGKKRKSPTVTVPAAGGTPEGTGDDVQAKKCKKEKGRAPVTTNKNRFIDTLATPTPAPKHQVVVSSALAKLQKGNHDSDSENVSPITVDAETEALRPLLGRRSWGSGISFGTNEDSYGPSPCPAPRAAAGARAGPGSRVQPSDGTGNGTDDEDDDDTIVLKDPRTTPTSCVSSSEAETETESNAAALFKEFCKPYDGDDEDSNKENAPICVDDDDNSNKNTSVEPATPSETILLAPASTPVTSPSRNTGNTNNNENENHRKGLEYLDSVIKSAFPDEYHGPATNQPKDNGGKSSKM